MIRQIPNLLSLARLAATPFLVWLLLAGDRRGALILCLAAGLTDVLDGFLARRLGSASQTGAYLDPVADKVMLSATFLAFGISAAVPVWLVALVLGRDALMLVAIGAILVFTRIRRFPPTVWGKLSTFVQIGFVLCVLSGVSTPLLVWIPAVATAWSGLHYAWLGAGMLRGRR
ncbi:MAG: CDP-alcohol phosphatidyltransferase family protein [Bryobacteraceae bacterium]